MNVCQTVTKLQLTMEVDCRRVTQLVPNRSKLLDVYQLLFKDVLFKKLNEFYCHIRFELQTFSEPQDGPATVFFTN